MGSQGASGQDGAYSPPGRQRAGMRHSGQALRMRSQRSTQCAWYTWLHFGSSLTRWPFPKSSRHMEQVLACIT